MAEISPIPPARSLALDRIDAIAGYAYCTITLSPSASVPFIPVDKIQIGYQGFWITLASNVILGTNSQCTGAIANPGEHDSGYVDANHGETPPGPLRR